MLLSNDSLSAVGEARLLHQSQQGYFCIARALPKSEERSRASWSQNFYPIGGLDGAAHAARNQADTYISQASFISARRAVANTKMLRCVYVDLDVYKLGLRADDATVMAIDRCAREAGLPEPTYITNSGRGLYAKWVFKDPITSDLLPQWQTLQDLLVALYRSLGSDAVVKDAARVLRLAQTINSKNGATVQVVHNRGTLYSFRELCAAAAKIDIPLAIGASRQRGQALRRVDLGDVPTDFSALANYSAIREPILMRHGTIQTLNWSRFLDLRDLVIARGGIRKGERDITLFWMTSFLAFSGVITPGNLWNEVRQLLLAFPVSQDFDPLNDGSLNTLISRIASHDRGEMISHHGRTHSPIYTPRNQLLLDMLEITPEEERGMRTIISSVEKQRRADDKVPGRADRRQEAAQSRLAAVALKAKGVSVPEIAETLGTHRRTIYKWLKPDELAGTAFVERRGRRAMPRDAMGSGYCTIRLTGAGPVPHPRLQEAQARQVEASGTPLTVCELSRRTKVRKQKEHLRPEKRWGEEELLAWMTRQKINAQERATNAERVAAHEALVQEAKIAQAALSTQVLLTKLRDGICARDADLAISNQQRFSVSSLSTLSIGGSSSSLHTSAKHVSEQPMSDVRARLEQLRSNSSPMQGVVAEIDMSAGEPELPPSGIPAPIRRPRAQAAPLARQPVRSQQLATRPLPQLRPPVSRESPSSAPDIQPPVQALEQVWPADDLRPAGSHFSVEAWLEVEAANPECIVYEIHKPKEVGLVAAPLDKLSAGGGDKGLYAMLLRRSLVIAESCSAGFPYLKESTVKIEHFDKVHGTFRYLLVRSQAEREKTPWLDGSILRNYSDSDRPPSGPGDRRERDTPYRPSRAERFGSSPR
jgi:hypothetical protein